MTDSRGAFERSGGAQPFGGDRGAARGYAEPPALSAATVAAERNGAFPRAEAPASAAEAAFTAADATERPQLGIRLLFVSHI
jgi:hypothetical protein